MRYVIREKFFALGEDSAITDEAGQTIYTVDGHVFSLHDTLTIRDNAGREAAQVQRQLISLTPTYYITRAGQEEAEVRKQFFSPFVDRFTIDIPGGEDLSMSGDFFEHEFTIKRGSTVVATVSKQWLSLTATYGVDIAAGEDDLLILASVLALDLAEDRERH
jgi:uncharacterized protein YxjI